MKYTNTNPPKSKSSAQTSEGRIRKLFKPVAKLFAAKVVNDASEGKKPSESNKINHDPFVNPPKVTVPYEKVSHKPRNVRFEDHLIRKER
jgi:hypothetical protein